MLQEQIELYVIGATEENERRLYSLQQRVMFYQQQIDLEMMQLDHDIMQQQQQQRQHLQHQDQYQMPQQQPLNNMNQVRFFCLLLLDKIGRSFFLKK